MAQAPPPVEFDRVTKRYGERTALEHLSLRLRANAITAVIGPSGSGKSTFLQLINGLLFPEEGRVQVFGKPVDAADLTNLRLQIGYAVQGTGLFPHLTVAKNITLLAQLTGWVRTRIEDRLVELMSLVNLPAAYRDKYPYQLSGGEQQRVGLCRAMMLNPPIFLLDEAFGALDPVTRGEIHREFIKLQSLQPRTVVLVTHDLREALRLADEVVILQNGRIEQVGTPTEVLEQPASEFVEHFVHLQLDDDIKSTISTAPGNLARDR